MRIVLGISYSGERYLGWQSQPNGQTIQDKLELSLKNLTRTSITTHCAGRTDAGVHALMQVVHFDTHVQRPITAWVRGLNSFLPADIAVQWAQETLPSFHCRSQALTRRYIYHLLESPVRPSIEAGRVGWVFKPLALESMQKAADFLIGTHDFSSFRASSCQSLTPVKHMHSIQIKHRGQPMNRYWSFEFEANAFLHHMIRNIMGNLIFIGQGSRPAHWMQDLLALRSRSAAAPTFSSSGLYFLGPTYANHWNLPTHTPNMHWLI